MTVFEGAKNLYLSFIIELIGTFILLVVIFSNTKPNSLYRKVVQIGKTSFTFGPVITGLTLITLLYILTYIAVKTNISAGHMFPLITIPAMFGRMGYLNVSVPKGLTLLLAQVLAMVFANLVIY
jgi:glycerol uptake facilitator-like aquaporin